MSNIKLQYIVYLLFCCSIHMKLCKPIPTIRKLYARWRLGCYSWVWSGLRTSPRSLVCRSPTRFSSWSRDGGSSSSSGPHSSRCPWTRGHYWPQQVNGSNLTKIFIFERKKKRLNIILQYLQSKFVSIFQISYYLKELKCFDIKKIYVTTKYKYVLELYILFQSFKIIKGLQWCSSKRYHTCTMIEYYTMAMIVIINNVYKFICETVIFNIIKILYSFCYFFFNRRHIWRPDIRTSCQCYDWNQSHARDHLQIQISSSGSHRICMPQGHRLVQNRLVPCNL